MEDFEIRKLEQLEASFLSLKKTMSYDDLCKLDIVLSKAAHDLEIILKRTEKIRNDVILEKKKRIN